MRIQVKTSELFATHPVFSLDEAEQALAAPGGRVGTVERLKHHLASGRLRLVTRGVYAVVPIGVPPDRFAPDPVLVAAAARPDAVFAYHTALELLGAAQSVWRECALFTASRRSAVRVNGATIRFLDHPGALCAKEAVRLGTRTVERQGRLLCVTGPERTLVECLRRPGLAGGLDEVLDSTGSFPVLDLALVEEVLLHYGVAVLWAATGWFLERLMVGFHVPEATLERFSRRRPRAPQYLDRGRRGGVMARRWNLIVPEGVSREGEPDDR